MKHAKLILPTLCALFLAGAAHANIGPTKPEILKNEKKVEAPTGGGGLTDDLCAKFPELAERLGCKKEKVMRAKMDNILKACGRFPKGHPMSCEKILSLAPKKGVLRGKDGKLKSVAGFGAVRTAAAGIFSGAIPNPVSAVKASD